MSADLHNLGGTAQMPRSNRALPISAVNTLRAPHVLPPRLSCDALGMCQHTALDCGDRCQREALDDGHVDVLLPTLGGGGFWLDANGAPEDPNGVTPGVQQPHLMYVHGQPSWRDTGWYTAYYWFWVAMAYLAAVVAAGYAWGKWGDSAMRAFWRVVTGVS